MHRKSLVGNLVPTDLEIEATCRRNRAERRRKFLQDIEAATILGEPQSSESSSIFQETRDIEVVEKFLKKYFLESKIAEGKIAISSFHQFLDESLSEALERFRSLPRTTPTHGFFKPIQLNIFINGLRPQS